MRILEWMFLINDWCFEDEFIWVLHGFRVVGCFFAGEYKLLDRFLFGRFWMIFHGAYFKKRLPMVFFLPLTVALCLASHIPAFGPKGLVKISSCHRQRGQLMTGWARGIRRSKNGWRQFEKKACHIVFYFCQVEFTKRFAIALSKKLSVLCPSHLHFGEGAANLSCKNTVQVPHGDTPAETKFIQCTASELPKQSLQRWNPKLWQNQTYHHRSKGHSFVKFSNSSRIWVHNACIVCFPLLLKNHLGEAICQVPKHGLRLDSQFFLPLVN